MTLVKELEKLCARYGEDIPRMDIESLIMEHCADQVCTAKERELIEADIAEWKLLGTSASHEQFRDAHTRRIIARNAVLAERKEKGE